jgi:hypothetical protein
VSVVEISDRLLDGSQYHKAARIHTQSDSAKSDPDNPRTRAQPEKPITVAKSETASKKDHDRVRVGLCDFAFYGILVTLIERPIIDGLGQSQH